MKASDDNKGLVFSAWAGDLAATEQALLRGADVNTKGLLTETNGRTALHWAALKKGDQGRKFCELLIGYGADVNDVNDEGVTPLHAAAGTGGCLPSVLTLLAAGADAGAKNILGRSPLHQAAHFNQPSYVPHLVAAGAGLCDKDDNGKTPLYLAWAAHNMQVVAILEQMILTHEIDQRMQANQPDQVALSRMARNKL